MTTTMVGTPDPDDRFITLEELAQLCRVPLNTVYAWRKFGKGPASYRVGKRALVRHADAIAWIESHAEGWGETA